MIICIYASWRNSHQACCSSRQSTIIPIIITIIKSIHWRWVAPLASAFSHKSCLPQLSPKETQENRELRGVHDKRRKADQRDAPTACLILSYVSRLNGSHCYQRHHASASCQREAHTNTAVIWQDSDHRWLRARKSDRKKLWTQLF